MAPRTLLLCFIHGFKGNEDTFDDFPEYLSEKVMAEAKEKEAALDVKVVVYPKYETRGDLPGCVEAFREWLLEQVFTSEKEAGNLSPRLEPSVGVVLIAHSMGGLVAADTLFTFLDAMPAHVLENSSLPSQKLFPLIQGVLALDTPYSGLSRAMFAYGAFAQYKSVTSAYGLVASLSGPIATYAGTSSTAAVNPALAVAALGALAYANRERIGQFVNKDDISRTLSAVNYENARSVLTGVSRDNIEQGLSYLGRQNLGNGFAWLSSHLQFVSALTKGQELKNRLERLCVMKGIGFANLYSSLGKNETWNGGYFTSERTFCAIPKETTKPASYFIKEVNLLAKDETEAHMTMFRKEKNQGYEELTKHAAGLVSSWARNHNGNVVNAWKNPANKETSSSNVSDSATSETQSGAIISGNQQNASWYNSYRYKRLSNYIPTFKSRSNTTMGNSQKFSSEADVHKEETTTEELGLIPQLSIEETQQEQQEEDAHTRAILQRTESTGSMPGVTEDLDFS